MMTGSHDADTTETLTARFVSQLTHRTNDGPVKRLLVERASGDRHTVVVPPTEFDRTHGLATDRQYRFVDLRRCPARRRADVTSSDSHEDGLEATSTEWSDGMPMPVSRGLWRAVARLDLDESFLIVTAASRIESVDGDRIDEIDANGTNG